jgi:tRNA threonylcarbamoyladenosine biosynthesis protein TsaB
MACIVHIETATDVCSVALSENGAILTSKENYDGPNHNVLLAPYVDEMVSFADSHAIPIDAVAVSCGPGSYTGLRIGVSTAKGLCYGRNLKLVSVSTLQLLCVPLLLHDNDIPEDALLCPMLDARRMEVYSAIYDRSLHTVKDISADIIDECSYKEILDKQPVAFFGHGADKCKKAIKHPNAIFIDDIKPLAKNMLPLAERAFLQSKWEDVAYFEPFYLKEFVTTQAKKHF